MISMPQPGHAPTSTPGEHWPQLALIATLMLAVGALDVFAGSQVSPWALYLLPISIGTANYGAKAGMALTCLATGLLALAAAVSGHPFASWAFFALSIANRSICMLAVAMLVAYVRRAPKWSDSTAGTGIGNY